MWTEGWLVYADAFLTGSWGVGFSRCESWIPGCKELVNVSGCGEWKLDLKRVEVCVYCVRHPVLTWERRRTKYQKGGKSRWNDKVCDRREV
jgi:hypothetical protein